MRNRKYITDKIAAIWYKCLIRPIIEYCAAVLFSGNNYLTNEIERIENRCLKIISSESKSVTRYRFYIHFIYLNAVSIINN